MNLLLDAHALLWFLNDDPQLVPNAKSLIESPANRKLVSIATCWEIAIKVGLKKLDLGEPATTFCHGNCRSTSSTCSESS